MIVVCQQPNFFPWIGYFEQIARADSFVFLDSVQWIKQGRQHRTKLPSPNEKNYWLSLPIKSQGHREKQLKDMQVEPGWSTRHLNILKNTYQKKPFYHSQVEPLIRPFFEKNKDEKFLLNICQESIFLFWELFSLKAQLYWSSDFHFASTKTERLVDICSQFGASQYYSALGSTRYLNLELFREKNIDVRWQHLKLFYPNDLHRPTDYSILDWLSYIELGDIQKILRVQSNITQSQCIPDHRNRT